MKPSLPDREPRALTIHQMRVFLKLVEAGSFSRAAIMVGVTQSALSRITAQMEAVLGTRLFERSGRGIVLTESGSILRDASSEMLRRYDIARAEIEDLGGTLRGECRVAMPESVGRILFLPLIRLMRAQHPHCAIRVVEAFSSTIPAMMQSAHVDVAIVTDTHPHVGLETNPLAREDFFLVGRAGDAIVAAPEMTLRDVGNLPLLLPGSSGGIRRVVDRVFAEQDVPMNVAMEIDSNEAQLDLVSVGDGYAILPYSAVHREVESGLVRAARIVRPAIRRHLYRAVPARGPISPVSREVFRRLADLVDSHRARAKWQRVETTGKA